MYGVRPYHRGEQFPFYRKHEYARKPLHIGFGLNKVGRMMRWYFDTPMRWHLDTYKAGLYGLVSK